MTDKTLKIASELQSVESEQSVLGAILYNSDVLSEIMFLDSNDFYKEAHVLIFSSIKTLYNKGKPIDTITVASHLKSIKKLDDAGGSYYLTGLHDSIPTIANTDYYAEQIKEFSLKRQLQIIGIEMSQDPQRDLNDSIAKFQERINKVTEAIPANGYIPGLVINDMYKYILDESEEAPMIIENGMLPEKSIMIVGGQPKTGKSLLVLNVAFCMATRQRWFDFNIPKCNKILFIQAENSYDNQRRRLKRLYKATEPPYTMKSPDKGMLMLSEPFSFKIDDNKDFLRLKHMIEFEKPNVVIIDPLINFHNCDENDNAAMGSVMEKLREITESLDISIIIVHHTRKPGLVDNKSGVSLRGAGVIFGSVDTIVILSAEKNDAGTVEHYLDFELRNDESPERMYVELDREILWFMKTDKQITQTVERWIIDILVQAKEDGIKQSDLVKLGKENGYAERMLQRNIKLMVQGGLIKSDKKERYRRVWYHSFYGGIPF